MLARIRKSIEDKDQGFTLIELLVVMIIVGILAAIAIPVFLNQRKKAVDAGIKTDLSTIATAQETYFTDNNAYLAAVSAQTDGNNAITIGDSVKLTKDNTYTVTLVGTDAFCIVGNSVNASRASHAWVYKSANGGLQPGNVTTCA